MKRKIKSIVSLILIVFMVLGTAPLESFIGVNIPEYLINDSIIASAATLSLNELKSKYSNGKYWNHVGSSNNNPNGWTNSPCPSHSSTSTCNAFMYNGSTIGWQCFGFALQLGYDAYGSNPKDWGRAYNLNNIKPGDIINYDGDNPGHTVFVTSVSGDTVTFAECNYGSRCIISWGRSLKKSQFNNLFNVYVAPYSLSNNDIHSHEYNGEGYEQLHPHKIYRICSCGDWYYTGGTTKLSTCLTCYPPTLKVYFSANGGSTSSDTYKISSNLIYNKSDSTKYYQSWTYDNTKENGLVNGVKTLGLYKTGYTFAGWGTKASGGTVFDDNDTTIKPSDLSSDIKNGSCSITLYAQWVPNTLSIYFNANGGSISSDTYKLSSNLVYNKSDSTKYYQKWTYNNTKENGLTNASTFGIYRIGYTFVGWGTKSTGGTVFGQGDNTLKPSDFNSNIVNGNCSTTLYAQWKANTYTIAFNGNGSTSGSMSKLSMTYGTAKNLTANAFAKTGYTFNGWNTKADGSGTSYTNKASVKNLTSTNGGTVTLYAQWKANAYTIVFNGNGSTSGSTTNLSMTYGTAKNLTANAFAKTGYTFNGWNTKANGSGTSYTNKASVKNLTSTNGGTVTLYAQWKANAYTIVFNGNGSTSGSMSKLSMTYGTAKNLTANTFVKNGYTFTGWNTKADGSGASYANKASVKNLTSTNGGTVTLYAIWQKNPVVTYTLTYNANGGSGAPSAQSGATSYAISSTKPTRSGYAFLGWSKSSTATTASYTSGDTISISANTTLYAVWQKNPVVTYTLTYNANGGSGAPSAQSGATSYMISSTKPARSGYLFLGWSESKTATLASYTSGDTIALTSDTILYAVWFRMPDLATTEVVIRKPSRVAVSYGDSLVLHADLNKTLPIGGRIEWTANNSNFNYTVSADGSTCTITPNKSGDTTFTVTVYDENENVISEDTQVMKSKAGFFDKLIAFFKKLFGATKIIQQSINTIY